MMANPAKSPGSGDVLADTFNDAEREQLSTEDASCWRDVVVILLSVIAMGVTMMAIAVLSIFKFGS